MKTVDVRILFVLLYAAMMPGCSPQLTNGTGSGGEARVMGKVVAVDGTPASGALVTILPSDFNPVAGIPSTEAGIRDTTDDNGGYSLTIAQPFAAKYTIQAVGIGRETKSLITGISVPGDGSEVQVQQDAVLQKQGRVKVLISDVTDTASGYVYLPGTTIFAPVHNGYAILDSMPAGLVPALCFSSPSDSTVNRVILSNVNVPAGDTVTIADVRNWKHSRKIFLNTTSSGAGVAGNVCHFPLLVRLTPAVFNFSEAASGGADIRFTKENSTPLPYEIERWDSASGAAEIWVLVDTVFGNDSTRYLTMLWGNADAVSLSNGPEVFDTADGWVGTWHFSPEHPYDDATAEGLGLVDSGTTPGQESIIAWDRSFNGTSAYLSRPSDPHLNVTGDMSISAWVKLTDPVVEQKIVGKSDDNSGYLLGVRDNGIYIEFWDTTGTHYQINTGTSIIKDEWAYLTVSWTKGGNLVGYVNGTQTLSIPASPFDIRPNTQSLILGAWPALPQFVPWYFAHGEIDEVRITKTSRTSDWVRLEFMNQQADNSLTVFK